VAKLFSKGLEKLAGDAQKKSRYVVVAVVFVFNAASRKTRVASLTVSMIFLIERCENETRKQKHPIHLEGSSSYSLIQLRSV